MTPFAKPHATALQRVQHLRAKGLTITHHNVAAKKIEQIGYERLRIYFLSRRDHSRAGRPFITGTTYKDIIDLYTFDTKLREICLAGVGQFELILRNRISEVLSAQFGSHPYFDISAFKDSQQHNEALQKLIQTYSKSRDERAKHYRQTYSEPPLPPIWTLKEFLTFGTSARFYGSLANPVRRQIASGFGVPHLQVFDSWVPCFVDLRNICAHHDRLFNRRFQKQPQCFRQASIPSAAPTTLKAQLECLDHVLNKSGAASGIVERVRKAINRYPGIQNSEVGY